MTTAKTSGILFLHWTTPKKRRGEKGEIVKTIFVTALALAACATDGQSITRYTVTGNSSTEVTPPDGKSVSAEEAPVVDTCGVPIGRNQKMMVWIIIDVRKESVVVFDNTTHEGFEIMITPGQAAAIEEYLKGENNPRTFVSEAVTPKGAVCQFLTNEVKA